MRIVTPVTAPRPRPLRARAPRELSRRKTRASVRARSLTRSPLRLRLPTSLPRNPGQSHRRISRREISSALRRTWPRTRSRMRRFATRSWTAATLRSTASTTRCVGTSDELRDVLTLDMQKTGALLENHDGGHCPQKATPSQKSGDHRQI